MKQVIDWIIQNYKLVVYGLCTLIILFCTILPKKVKVQDTVKEAILSMLPELISKVEEPGNGKEKLKAVIEMCVAAISKLFPGVNANQYISFIKQSVEAIGKAPHFTKKGQVFYAR